MKPIKKNKSQSVQVVDPMIDESADSSESLKSLLGKEETISNLSFDRSLEESIRVAYKTIKECVFNNLTSLM